MKMIKIVLLSTLFTLGTSALANTLPPTRTYETTVQKLRMPTTPNGTITLRECDDCEFETYRVTPRTRYSLDKKDMRLEDFRVVIENLRLSGDRTVNVTRDIETNTIINVFLFTQ